MLNRKERDLVKTFDNIIKNKKKNLSIYMKNKLTNLIKINNSKKLKGGEFNEFGITNTVKLNEDEQQEFSVYLDFRLRGNKDFINNLKKYKSESGNLSEEGKNTLNKFKKYYNQEKEKWNNYKKTLNTIEPPNKKKKVIMDSKDFVEKAFDLDGISDDDNNFKINTLNILFNQYKVKQYGGGKSGATVIGLQVPEYFKEKVSNNTASNEKFISKWSGKWKTIYIFKYSEDAKRKIMVNKDGKKNTNRQSMNKMNVTKRKYDSSYKYIRAIREIYLSKKFDEHYKKIEENNKIIKKEKLNSAKSANIPKDKENIKNRMSEIELTPSVFNLGFLKNCSIKLEKRYFDNNNGGILEMIDNGISRHVTENDIGKLKSNKSSYLNQRLKNIIRNNNYQEGQILIIKLKQTTNNSKIKTDEYIPFILQEFNKGDTLESCVSQKHYKDIPQTRKYLFSKTSVKKQKLQKDFKPINDLQRIAILKELSITLLKFKEMIHAEQGYNGIKRLGCHRDMHPGNIFIENIDDENTDKIRVKLIDFDLSITDKKELTYDTRCTRESLSPTNIGPGIKKYDTSIAGTIDYIEERVNPSLIPTKGNKYVEYFNKIIKIASNVKEDNDLVQFFLFYLKFTDDMDGPNNENLKKVLDTILRKSLYKIEPENIRKYELSESNNNTLRKLSNVDSYQKLSRSRISNTDSLSKEKISHILVVLFIKLNSLYEIAKNNYNVTQKKTLLNAHQELELLKNNKIIKII